MSDADAKTLLDEAAQRPECDEVFLRSPFGATNEDAFRLMTKIRVQKERPDRAIWRTKE